MELENDDPYPSLHSMLGRRANMFHDISYHVRSVLNPDDHNFAKKIEIILFRDHSLGEIFRLLCNDRQTLNDMILRKLETLKNEEYTAYHDTE